MSRRGQFRRLAVVATVAVAAGACASSDSGGAEKVAVADEATTSTTTGVTVASRALAAAPAGGCEAVPVSLVEQKLGMTGLQSVAGQLKTGGLVCGYNNADGSPAATLQMNAAATAESFGLARDAFTKNGAPVTLVSGLGDEAYSSTFTFGRTSQTLVVRRGSTEVLITSTAPAEAVRALMDAVLAAV